MNNKLIAAIAAASVLGSATSVAASGDDHGHRKWPKFSIEEMDTNGDQMISKEEIAAHAKARFDQVDTNDDGKLSADEMAAHGEKEMTKRMEKRQAKMVKRMDADDDGMLSAEELEKMKRKGKRHGEKHDHKDDDHD